MRNIMAWHLEWKADHMGAMGAPTSRMVMVVLLMVIVSNSTPTVGDVWKEMGLGLVFLVGLVVRWRS